MLHRPAPAPTLSCCYFNQVLVPITVLACLHRKRGAGGTLLAVLQGKLQLTALPLMQLMLELPLLQRLEQLLAQLSCLLGYWHC